MNDCSSAVTLKVIAHIHTDFSSKFGIPRQSGIIEDLEATIVFEPEYRNPAAFRGMEGFSHLWLIWEFSEARRDGWSATVHPPRLGGNQRMGVFATRSPFRPNPIGLSCVSLSRIEFDPVQGPLLRVRGADLMDGTPIFDIKPYLPFTDCRPEAAGGFAAPVKDYHLDVVFPDEWLDFIPEAKREALCAVLAQDPRPAYQNDPERIYGFPFAGYDVRFRVKDGVLTVCDVVCL
jgi:tRNA-Thr(GGU) m(6)t(6)A37 methyltransferase TsaA